MNHWGSISFDRWVVGGRHIASQFIVKKILVAHDHPFLSMGRQKNGLKWQQFGWLVSEEKVWEKNKVLIAEILHLLTCSLSHYLWGVFHPNWCRMSPINNMGQLTWHFVGRNSSSDPTSSCDVSPFQSRTRKRPRKLPSRGRWGCWSADYKWTWRVKQQFWSPDPHFRLWTLALQIESLQWWIVHMKTMSR